MLNVKTFWQDKKSKLLGALDLLQHAEQTSKDIPELLGIAQHTAQSLLSGYHALHKAGHGQEFWQFRPHDQSDRPQDIDWRQSAKGDQIFIRQTEWQTAQKIQIWCDTNNGMDFQSDQAPYSKKESAAILSLTLAMLLTKSGENIKLLGANMRAGRTRQTIQKMADILWNDETPVNQDTLTHHPISPKSTIILIGDFLNDVQETQNILQSFSQRGSSGILIQTLDPDEIDFPFKGRYLFNTPDQKIKFDIAQTRSIQSAYKERIQNHIETLKQSCESEGWDYHLHITNTPSQETLLEIWRKCEERRSHS